MFHHKTDFLSLQVPLTLSLSLILSMNNNIKGEKGGTSVAVLIVSSSFRSLGHVSVWRMYRNRKLKVLYLQFRL